MRQQRVELTCPCGTKYQVLPLRAAQSKYCSRSCRAKYTEGFRYPKGRKQWNSGTAGQGLLPNGSTHHNWKGDKVGYQALHCWLRRWYGKAQQCEYCGTTDGRIEWANKTGQYLRDRSDWLNLCRRHHNWYDRRPEFRAEVQAKLSELPCAS
jgi:hypothetical protein